jgi:hypothetical protein
MTERFDQACPLCQKTATYADFDFGNRKALDCQSCGQYVITRTAERMLSNPPGEREQQLSTFVKSAPDTMIAEIRTENQPNGGKGITAEILSRASMRLP